MNSSTTRARSESKSIIQHFPTCTFCLCQFVNQQQECRREHELGVSDFFNKPSSPVCVFSHNFNMLTSSLLQINPQRLHSHKEPAVSFNGNAVNELLRPSDRSPDYYHTHTQQQQQQQHEIKSRNVNTSAFYVTKYSKLQLLVVVEVTCR